MYSAPKGMNDCLPQHPDAFLQSHLWQHLQNLCQNLFARYNYQQVWLPIVEELGLFVRGLGENTDIVSKEMYTFADRGDRQLALRPEGTAGAARAYLSHAYHKIESMQKWWYLGPMYRAERPQKGRYRQFYQIGAEWFGVASPAADVELMAMAWQLCQTLQINNIHMRINSLGDAACRERYRMALRKSMAPLAEQLCSSCQQRLQHNPLRLLDCKKPSCQQLMAAAPDIRDYLDPQGETWLGQVESMLQQLGIPFQRERRLVRGLDYYNGVIFECVTSALGAQDAILGGGRYDQLLASMGGMETPAVGFAAGVERLALLMTQQAALEPTGPHLYLVPLHEVDTTLCLLLAQDLRHHTPWQVEMHGALVHGKPKSALRRADKIKARTVLVIGEQEQLSKQGQLKQLATGAVATVDLTVQGLAQGLGQWLTPPFHGLGALA